MRSARIRVLILALADALVMAAVWALIALVKSGSVSHWWEVLPFLIVFLIFNGLIKLYHGNVFYPGIALPPVEELRRLAFSVSLIYLLLVTYRLVEHGALTAESWAAVCLGWFLSCLLVVPGRSLARWIMKRCRVGQIPVLIAGAGYTGCLLERELRHDDYLGLRVVGFFDDDPAKFAPGDRRRVLGPLRKAVPFSRAHGIRYLICCLPPRALQNELGNYLRNFIHVCLVPDNRVFPISWAYPANLNGIAGMEIRNQLLLRGPRFFKNLMETLISLIGVLLLSPLLLILAVLVKLSSPGPILYKARRIGFGGKIIEVLKFRTMYQDADQQLEQILQINPVLAEEWNARFKLSEDPRVTRLGRLLRRTSLDELPQLFNVLRGEMAMIGPRPIVEAEKKYYGDSFDLFIRVKPGITGLWQVSGRSNTSYDKRVKLDLFYILNWSFWLDLLILQRTVFEVLLGRGAK